MELTRNSVKNLRYVANEYKAIQSTGVQAGLGIDRGHLWEALMSDKEHSTKCCKLVFDIV